MIKNNKKENKTTLRLPEMEVKKITDVINWVLVATRMTKEERLLLENVLHRIRKARAQCS